MKTVDGAEVIKLYSIKTLDNGYSCVAEVKTTIEKYTKIPVSDLRTETQYEFDLVNRLISKAWLEAP